MYGRAGFAYLRQVVSLICTLQNPQ